VTTGSLATSARRPTGLIALGSTIAAIGVALFVYSQTKAFAWDEGFHLLTAQLIKQGKRPYLDFVFSQTPLNAYWNAMWMRLVSESWQTPHGVAACMTTLATLAAALWTLRHFPIPAWRLPAAILVAFSIGFDIQVFEYGTVAQAYGLAIFCIVAAYCAAVAAVERANPLHAAASGFLACAAAASTLLTAPVAPVLLIWMWFCNRAGSKIVKSTAFLVAGAIPFLPVLRLYLEGPRQTIFSIVDYNFRYREVKWDGATEHNLDVLTMWIESPQALLLGLLAIAGLWFVARRSGWDSEVRARFYLCAGLAAALGLHISVAKPTFQRYYLFLVPFLAILAAVGLYAIAARMDREERPWRPVLLLCAFSVLAIGRMLFSTFDDLKWAQLEQLAGIVKQVSTDRNKFLGDEQMYFLLGWTPPPGMELMDSHKIETLPASEYKLLHLVPQMERDKRVLAGEFQTVESCGEEKYDLPIDLAKLYTQKKEVEECAVYWDFAPPKATTGPAGSTSR